MCFLLSKRDFKTILFRTASDAKTLQIAIVGKEQMSVVSGAILNRIKLSTSIYMAIECDIICAANLIYTDATIKKSASLVSCSLFTGTVIKS